jgi:outer membrane protein
MSRRLAILILAAFATCVRGEEKPVPPIKAAEAFPEPAAVPVPPGPFDLQTCFELSVLRSETLGMKEEDIRIAQARYWQAVGAILPKVHLLVSESLRNKTAGGGGGSSTGVINSGSGGDTEFFGGGGGGSRTDSFTSRINVKQPIFSGFREFNAGQAASADVRARTHDRRRSNQLLYLDVADVFYQCLMYEGDLKILSSVQKTLKDRIVELERWVKLGKSRTGELLMAQSDLAGSQVIVEQTKGLLGASRELLAFLTGVPAVALNLEDKTPFPKAEAVEAYLRETGERADILAAIETERSARKQLSAVKGEHWPTINAEGNYYLKQSPDRKQEWNIFLTFDLPIFEGGIIESRVSEQKALVRQSQLNLEQLRRTADKDVRVAYNNFIAAAAQVLRLKEATQISRENFRVQSEDYKLGIVTNLDVLAALRQMYDQRQKLLDAQMEARINLVRLHVAAGETPPTPGATPDKAPFRPDASRSAPPPTDEDED